jgi:glycine cleavage system aminomethyltransferase T
VTIPFKYTLHNPKLLYQRFRDKLTRLFEIPQIAREKQFKVQIDNITDEINVVSIAGPNAAKLLEAVGVPHVHDWKFLEAREVSG